jgi:preprotein translocase subunit SecE
VNYSIIIPIVVIAIAFGLLWYSGQLKRFKDYWDETWVELQKCTWPTWAELKGSTIVVIISIVILGGFTMGVDWCFLHMVLWLT